MDGQANICLSPGVLWCYMEEGTSPAWDPFMDQVPREDSDWQPAHSPCCPVGRGDDLRLCFQEDAECWFGNCCFDCCPTTGHCKPNMMDVASDQAMSCDSDVSWHAPCDSMLQVIVHVNGVQALQLLTAPAA